MLQCTIIDPSTPRSSKLGLPFTFTKMPLRTSPFSHHSTCSTHPIIRRMTFGRRSEQLGALSTVWWDVRTKVGLGAQEGPLWGTVLLRLSPTLDTTDAPKYCNQNGHHTRSQSPETLLPTAVAARARNA